MGPTQTQTRKELALDIKYHEIYKNQKNPAWLRKRVVKYAQRNGQRAAARHFECSINTVSKWLKRKDEPEEICFKNRSRRPKTIKTRISPEIEQYILSCWEKEHMGGRNLKHQYNVPVSEITTYRVLKRNGRVNQRKKKYRQTKDLRKIKAKQKCFETVQVDGKVLNDIPNFYPYYIKYQLPLWQFTFTCEKSGMTFFAYCKGETSIAACTFIVYVLEHLKRNGIKVKKIKTDKGSFAVARRSLNHTAFQNLLKNKYNIKHQAIVHKNQNADVERFHGLVEQYFYSVFQFDSKKDFYAKATERQVWFNLYRLNSGKEWKTPIEILKEDYPNIDPQIVGLTPINLDEHQQIYFYKLDPNYKPLTFDDFFCDVPEEELDNIRSADSDLVYHHVMKLDV